MTTSRSTPAAHKRTKCDAVSLPQVPSESRVGAAVWLSGESPPALPLHRQGILGKQRRGQRYQAPHPDRGAERKDSPPAREREEDAAEKRLVNEPPGTAGTTETRVDSSHRPATARSPRGHQRKGTHTLVTSGAAD